MPAYRETTADDLTLRTETRLAFQNGEKSGGESNSFYPLKLPINKLSDVLDAFRQASREAKLSEELTIYLMRIAVGEEVLEVSGQPPRQVAERIAEFVGGANNSLKTELTKYDALRDIAALQPVSYKRLAIACIGLSITLAIMLAVAVISNAENLAPLYPAIIKIIGAIVTFLVLGIRAWKADDQNYTKMEARQALRQKTVSDKTRQYFQKLKQAHELYELLRKTENEADLDAFNQAREKEKLIVLLEECLALGNDDEFQPLYLEIPQTLAELKLRIGTTLLEAPAPGEEEPETGSPPRPAQRGSGSHYE